MSDSINEQRCNHGKTEAHPWNPEGTYSNGPARLCPGPSVVTPPAQDGQREFVTYGPTPLPAAPSVSTDIDNLRAENARLTRERDLAIAHDTQPYPTAWAYEQACRVMHETKAERDALQAEVERLNEVVASMDRNYDGLAQEHVDLVAANSALQARIDAVLTTWKDCSWWAQDSNWDPMHRAIAAFGVDPQNEARDA